MSQRLNKANREVLLKALLDQRFGEEAKAVVDAFAKIADELYEAWAKKYKVHPDTLPSGWMRTNTHFSVVAGGETYRLYFDGTSSWTSDIRRRVPQMDAPLAQYDAADPITIRLRELAARRKQLNEDREAAARVVKAALDRFNTVEALLKAWPEAKPFITVVGKLPPTMLPVVQTQELNAILGLKPVLEPEAVA